MISFNQVFSNTNISSLQFHFGKIKFDPGKTIDVENISWIKMPHLQIKKENSGAEEIWIRVHTYPIRNGVPALLLMHTYSPIQVYSTMGNLLYNYLDFSNKHEVIENARWEILSLPEWKGDSDILIRVQNTSLFTGQLEIYYGEEKQILSDKIFLRNISLFMVGFCLLVFGIGAMFFINTKDKGLYISFGLYLLFMGFKFISYSPLKQFIQDFPFPWGIIHMITTNLCIIFLVEFFRYFFKNEKKSMYNILNLINIVITLSVFILLLIPIVKIVMVLENILIFINVLIIVPIVLKAYFNEPGKVRPIILGGLFLSGSELVSFSRSLGLDVPIVAHWGALIFIGCLFFVILEHYKSTRKELHKYSMELEHKNAQLSELLNNIEDKDEQLIQAQKMEMMGFMASGIVHDLNNLLAIIRGYAELIAISGTEKEENEDVKIILHTVDDACTLTQHLLSFSRQTQTGIKSVYTDELIQEYLIIMKKILGPEISIISNLQAVEVYIDIAPIHLEQIILNLLINAKDAIPDKGNIFVSTYISESIQPECNIIKQTFLNPPLCIEIRDTGTGIDENTLARMFTPFFMTKGKVKGTGLGLFTVQTLIRKYQGGLFLKSEPGKGTVFKVLLPLFQD